MHAELFHGLTICAFALVFSVAVVVTLFRMF